MATFAINLLNGEQYLFNETFASAGNSVSGASNGLTISGGIVGLGGQLCQDTNIDGNSFGLFINNTSSLSLGTWDICGNNTTFCICPSDFSIFQSDLGKPINYGGDYSSCYINRSLVDQGYVCSVTSGLTTGYTFFGCGGTSISVNGGNVCICSAPATGTTVLWGNITGSIINQTDLNACLNARLLKTTFATYTGTTVPNTYYNKTQINSFTGTTLPTNYYNKTQINSYTGSTTLCRVTTIGASTNVESCFKSGLVTNKIRPTGNTTTAIQITKANGTTSIINVDTISGFTGFGTIAPQGLIHAYGTHTVLSPLGIENNHIGIDGPLNVDKDFAWFDNGDEKWIASIYRCEGAKFWYLANIPALESPIVVSETGRVGINNPSNIMNYHAAMISGGSALDDIVVGGVYTLNSLTVYQVQINGTGIPDTFRWRTSIDNGLTYGAYSSTSGVTLTPTLLSNGVTVQWTHTTGHTVGTAWEFGAFAQLPVGTFIVSVNGFNEVQSSNDWSAGTVIYSDISAEANSATTGDEITIFNTGTTLNALYFGTSIPLDSMYINLKTAGAGVLLLTEYWNGITWVNLTTATNVYQDGTLNLTQPGNLQWETTTMPDWIQDNIPNLTGTTNFLYWLRIRTSTTPTIAPLASSFARGGDKRFAVFTSPFDYIPSMYIDSLGRTSIGGGNMTGNNRLQVNCGHNVTVTSTGTDSLVEFDSQCSSVIDLKIKLASNDACGPGLTFVKTRGTLDDSCCTQVNDILGRISYRGRAGTQGRLVAETGAIFVGSPTTCCGSLYFSTSNQSNPIERMRIRYNGNVGIGLTGATALLHLCSGSTTNAPLKFNSGSLLSSPQVGAVEFLTDAWYGTITTGTARKTFAFLESPQFTGNVNLPTTTCLNSSSLCNYILTSGGTNNTTLVKATTFNTYTGTTAPILNSTVTGATNGLTKSGRNVLLGGTLCQNTTVTGNTFNLCISVKQLDLLATNGICLLDRCGANINIVSNAGVIDLHGNTSSSVEKTKFTVSDTNVTFTDCRALTTGIEYNADYSGDYSDRSLVDKGYVDTHAGGLFPKTAVSLATTTGITLSGNQTIDGILTTTGMRVLVKNQTSGATNGVYSASTGTWGRTSDFDTDAEVVNGSYFFILTGNTNKNTAWILSTPNPITVGVTSLSFTLFSQAGGVTAGNGICVTAIGGNSNVAIKLGANCGLCVGGGGLCVSPSIAGVGLCYNLGVLCFDGTGVAGNSLTWSGTQLNVNISGGTLSTALNSKLNTTIYQTYTGTTVPNTYYNKTCINSYTAQTLTNINTRLLTTIYQTYTGTTVPNTYYNKTQINSYTGKTQTTLNAKAFLSGATFTGVIRGVTPGTNDNSTCIATTAYYIGQAGTANPFGIGTVCIGTSNLFSRQDHIHPINSSDKEILFNKNNTLTGNTTLIYCHTCCSLQLGTIAVASGAVSMALAGGQAIGTRSFAQGCANNACASFSAILAGSGNTICSGALRSAAIGGTGISLTGATYNDTVAVNCLAIWNTPTTGDISTEKTLFWNSTNKKIEAIQLTGGSDSYFYTDSTTSTSTASATCIRYLSGTPWTFKAGKYLIDFNATIGNSANGGTTLVKFSCDGTVIGGANLCYIAAANAGSHLAVSLSRDLSMSATCHCLEIYYWAGANTACIFSGAIRARRIC